MPKKATVADVQKFRKVLDGQEYVNCPCGAEVRVGIDSEGFRCPSCGHWVRKEQGDSP